MRLLQVLLFPFSFCYGMVMMVRNLLFNTGILPSESFDIPVISVGNLSYGGTGKTPHIEYLIRLLSPVVPTAALSRGYGRKSKGFFLVSEKSDVKETGDESLQLAKKFDKITVAVDEKRVRGIRTLCEKHPGTGLILLDDAFQHRWVKPGLSILLTDYHRLYTEDHVLPSGTLREFRTGAQRADIIIVTKTPKVFSPITRRRIQSDINPGKWQHLFFSYISYGSPVPFNEDQDTSILQKMSYILLFTGIANDEPLQEEVSRRCSELAVMKFPDHHFYEMKDIEAIKKRFDDLPTRKKILMTTEKDLMRLKQTEFSTILKKLPLFYLPIEIDFHGTDKQMFDKLITEYVTKS
jgi:tetraacyldisaccharide 4'-kinase